MQKECNHEWIAHGEKAFYCSNCGYFIETLEELKVAMDHERNAVVSSVEKILDSAGVSDEIKQKIRELRREK